MILRLASLLGFASLALSASIDISTERRASKSYPVSVSRNGSIEGFGFSHAANNAYTATIYVNGVAYQVILDTGSSDTWIDPLAVGGIVPPNVIETGINSSTSYVDGSVSTGPVVLADISFGPYTIKNQALTISYNASPDSQFSSGLIGLGGTAGSEIYSLLSNTTYEENGRAILYNLFEHEPDLPNYTAWLMSRSELGITDGGVLTVSEVLSNMTAALDAPRFDSPIPADWTTYMDGLYVNGRLISGYSNITAEYEKANIHVPKDNTVVTFDTGTSFIRGPNYYAHAIYKDLPGAALTDKIDPSGQSVWYTVPCNTKLNLTFSFSGNKYPIHPIDAIEVFMNGDGTFMCVGTVSGGDVPAADWLLGAAFLRNTYQIYDYGNSSDIRARPSTQLLSLVDQDKAWAEADSMMLTRLVAYEASYTATSGLPHTTPTHAQSYSGAVPTAGVTSVDNEKNSVPTTAALAGALAEDAASSSAGGTDLSGLMRNSYIGLGLLGAVLVLLFVVVVLSVKSNRPEKGYRPLGNTGRRAMPMADTASDPFYSTPYDKPE
ncbi:acid protease [Lentinus tigrinus ALCF2SS1-7]|uniref:Acid protease n=1 Tax=Lentinus tigrinus ALCF2SS1-6 TaxID=1328759 RepID=A0A5C2SB52_9APHY|nr:acid protease [Lentinus tigrinus ALCF2SS1-6]RPD75750.1 acid protease [Lentinus tigrinus ALCF2SS1-7]